MIEFHEYLPEAFRKSLTTKELLMTSTKDKLAKRKVDKDEYNTNL